MVTTISFDVDNDGIALLTIDVPGQSMNVIGPEFLADLDAAIDRIAAEEAIKGAVIASGKASGFMAGMVIEQGLKAGDRVVVEGVQNIRPGSPVAAEPWTPPAAVVAAAAETPAS